MRSYYLRYILFIIPGALLGLSAFVFIRQEAYASAKEIEQIRKAEQASVAQIIRRMSLRAKVGQLFHVGIKGKELSQSSQALLQKYQVGGVILFAYNLSGGKSQIQHLTRQLQQTALNSNSIPFLISTDQEGGRIKRVPGEAALELPSAMAIGQTDNVQYAEEAAFITAYLLRQMGINWVLAPVLDVNNNPHNPVINIRSFGAQTDLVTRMGLAYLKGNRKALSTATLKHFPGHGDTNIDSHLALPRIDKDMAALQKVELRPFQAAIQKGMAEVVMSAHILFTTLDAQHPATLSHKILQKILRQQWNYQGLIMSDAMEMEAIAQNYDPASAARLAFQAGIDIILLTKESQAEQRLKKMYTALLRDFQHQHLSLAALDRAVERQIRLKVRKGLFYFAAQPKASETQVTITANYPILRKHWQNLSQKADTYYTQLQRNYKKLGFNLSTAIARDSITALPTAFQGLASWKDFHRLRFFCVSQYMRKQALRMGIAAKQLRQALPTHVSAADFAAFMRQRPPNEIWVIELLPSMRKAWNHFVRNQKNNVNSTYNTYSTTVHNSAQQQATAPYTIALYSGNPFLHLESLAAQHIILLSYSGGRASQAALVYRLLYPQKMIRAALLPSS